MVIYDRILIAGNINISLNLRRAKHRIRKFNKINLLLSRDNYGFNGEESEQEEAKSFN